MNEGKLYKVSSWIREQNDEFNITPKIDEKKFNEILEMKDKTIQEKFDLLLFYLKDKKNLEIESYNFNCNIYPKCWIKSSDELDMIFVHAVNKQLIYGEVKRLQHNKFVIFYQGLQFNGLQYIESLEQPNKSSKNIFVAFNFEEGLSKIFNTYVKEAIEALGFNYTIVTQDTTTHNKAISDEIIAKLKSSRIVIADFTNHRNSVYFEAGFAMGMKIPIIWTCQEGHENDLSFDTRQYPHLVWTDGEDLAKQISNRIQVII